MVKNTRFTKHHSIRCTDAILSFPDTHLAECRPLVTTRANSSRANSLNSHSSSPLPVCAAEGEPGQRGADVDTAGQQLRLKERRFFEEVFQHDVDVYLSSAHLTLREHRRRESAGRFSSTHSGLPVD